MTLYLRRRAVFSAGFRQPPPGKSDEGHDYTVELTVGGRVDPATGMVVNIKDVDAVVQAKVVQPLHGKLLDEDVAHFQEQPPTPENLARFIWRECSDALAVPAKLTRVTLWPNALLKSELSLTAHQENPMLTVTRMYDFSASHRLHSAALSADDNAEVFGKCNWENGHGHNYEVEVTLAGDVNPRSGQLWDGRSLDKIVSEEVLIPYDHRHLNHDVPEFQTLNPTSENLTKVIWDKIERRLSCEDLDGARLYRVAVRETPRNYFEYYGE